VQGTTHAPLEAAAFLQVRYACPQASLVRLAHCKPTEKVDEMSKKK
jgi:hypothetical protein